MSDYREDILEWYVRPSPVIKHLEDGSPLHMRLKVTRNGVTVMTRVRLDDLFTYPRWRKIMERKLLDMRRVLRREARR